MHSELLDRGCVREGDATVKRVDTGVKVWASLADVESVVPPHLGPRQGYSRRPCRMSLLKRGDLAMGAPLPWSMPVLVADSCLSSLMTTRALLFLLSRTLGAVEAMGPGCGDGSKDISRWNHITSHLITFRHSLIGGLIVRVDAGFKWEGAETMRVYER
jgi:hypothetical protein